MNAVTPPSHDIIRPDKDRFLGEDNPFEAMMSRFDFAAEKLSLDPGLYKVLRMPEKQIIVTVPILRDSGEVDVYTGYRVLYNTSRGPAKGGIRFDTAVTLDEAHSSPGVSPKRRVSVGGRRRTSMCKSTASSPADPAWQPAGQCRRSGVWRFD